MRWDNRPAAAVIEGIRPGPAAVDSATTLGGLLGAHKKGAFAATLNAAVKPPTELGG